MSDVSLEKPSPADLYVEQDILTYLTYVDKLICRSSHAYLYVEQGILINVDM